MQYHMDDDVAIDFYKLLEKERAKYKKNKVKILI